MYGFGDSLAILGVPVMVAIPLSLVLRWRRADAVVRAQITLLLYVVGVYTVAGVVGFTALDGNAAEAFSDAFFMSLFVVIPTTVGAAVLRYGLWNIDRVVSRTVSYAILTAMLALPYLAIVTGVTQLASSDLAVALATLAAAALFQPLRRRVQDRVDRRFNRSKYDAARTVETFRTQLRDHVELDALRGDLIRAVAATVQPARATLWLRAGPGS